MRRKRAVAAATACALTAATLAFVPTSAFGAPVPGNESDVGVYTNGETDSMDIGDPTYTNLAEVEQKLLPGVDWTADSMHDAIFQKDLAAGGTDYYLDRILGVAGTANNTVLQTRGRSLYLRGGSSWNVMGFAGSAFTGGPNNLGSLYSVFVPGQTIAEVGAERFNAPSHASSRYTIGTTGVVADMRKFITYDNVAVTTVAFENPGATAQTFTVRTSSPLATGAGDEGDELIGTRTITSGSNNGLNDTPWAEVDIALKAPGFVRSGSNLDREITVAAGGTVELSVIGALYSDDMPAGLEQARAYAARTPADAFREGVTEFNQRWAQDIPYIDVPDAAIEKALVYRWWGERYNSLDTNESGYVYQYPTTIEGVNLYQNSVVLTQPMHLQDTKWIRNPYLAYGQILNVGELSGSSAFLDSPGHTSWNNHYSQYMGTAGLEAYNVYGGGPEIAERFATYFEGDGKGQLEHYDGNDDMLIAYDTNYMPGNDSDAITFGYPRSNASAPGARTIERPESAYVWGAFDAARQLYAQAGADEAKVDEMATTADQIQTAVLDRLWSGETRMFLAGTSHGAQSAPSSGTGTNPLSAAERDLIPAKESNLYDIYAEGLIPKEDAETYVDGYRFLRYGDNFPIFPFYTANQYDRAKFGIGGSNNFSNINFTVQYRAVRAALRDYDPEQKYITPEYAARLLDWMAWSIYPNGDARVANQAEYYSNWNQAAKTYNRNNPNHVMLGNMNYIYVEDMGGIRPRADDKIELWPIDLGYENFMVNNLRYHGKDLTIVWDEDGSEYGLGAGYSLFIDGERKATADALGRFVYDPAANEVVESDEGLNVDVVSEEGADVPSAVDTPIDDARVVSYLKTAGIDLEEDAGNLAADAALASSYTQQGVRPTPWRNFHTPGWGTGSMNYTPGAIKETERPVSLNAVTDGTTVNEPYWGNYGTTEANGYIDIDFGTPRRFDNVKLWFVSDRQAGGYREPQGYSIQVQNGAGEWVSMPDAFKAPKIPGPKFNEALFEPVTASKVRVAFTNTPSYYTAISEIQVFDSGREVPAVVNDAPIVTATADRSSDGNLSTTLVGTVSDDGIPETGSLSHRWSTVSAPEGAGVIFADDEALRTAVTGTVAGAYVFRLEASDGELTSQRDVQVDLTEKATSEEYGAVAAITSSGSASWENQNRVNEATTPASSAPGSGNGWGTWGQAASGTSPASAAWLRYTWQSPVRVGSTEIYWYDDNGGTRAPRADTYVIEYSNDGTTWTPVTLTNGSTYAAALTRNAYNRLEFEPVEASQLRIRITGVQGSGAGTGVLRWRVNGETVEGLDAPVVIRTVVGEIPELPAELDVVFASGSRGSVPFVWQEITAEQVAETNVEPFVVYGTNTAYGLIAEAQIYVRPENSQGGISIQGAQQFEQAVEVGELPWLPERVAVSYNDGSRDNRAIGVEWDFDESIVDVPGVYTITGNLVLPSYVSTAGTTSTTLTLTVGDGVAPGPNVSATVDTRCVAGKIQLVVKATNEHDGPVTLALASEYGTKQVTGVEAGKSTSQAFAVRATSVVAGDVSVTATAADGSTKTVDASYAAKSCG
ncbi:discoidin domain-containing protein [Microbacterium sp. BWT-G7]|uniref:Discoidin domain-containing protein n=2 Tax=Microbacterium allomyrinae TaxID=2830666 RepID=A0A9X1S1B0_9MICO|nr:discoidin domain-containing protein [Microbacterium allomyrinae]